MVGQPHRPDPDGAIAQIMLPPFQNRHFGKINRIIQNPHRSPANAFQFFIAVNIGQIDRHQIADMNQTAAHFADNLAVFDSLRIKPCRLDVAVRFRTQVCTDNHAVMLVRIILVQRILESDIRHTCFNLRAHHFFQQLLRRNKLKHLQLAELRIQIKLLIDPVKFFPPQIAQLNLIFCPHFRGVNHQPVFIGFHFLHKQIRHHHLRKDIIGFHSLVAVFRPQLKKIFNIHMPHIK